MKLRRPRDGARGLGLLLLIGALHAAGPASAQVVEEGTRVAAQGGWRWAPNGGFAERARALGMPLTGTPRGGPSMLLVFGYRPLASLEIAAEIGYAHERFDFTGGESLSLTQVPLLVAARFYPWSGGLTPYFGGGIGYFLNFMDGIEAFESHTSGPFLLAGLSLGVGERLAVFAEARGAFIVAELGAPAGLALGTLQTGGVSLMLGAQFSFPPEKRELDLR
jgi:hypothetical protein